MKITKREYRTTIFPAGPWITFSVLDTTMFMSDDGGYTIETARLENAAVLR